MNEERIKRLRKNGFATRDVLEQMIRCYGEEDPSRGLIACGEWRRFLEERLEGLDVASDIVGVLQDALGMDLSGCRLAIVENKSELENEIKYVMELEKEGEEE